MNINTKKHSFSLEVRNRGAITNFQMSTNPNEAYLIEGYLGDIVSLKLIEGLVLEIEGTYGILRMDLDKHELHEFIEYENRKNPD